MKLEKIVHNNVPIAIADGDGKIITDARSAVDLIMSASYELDTKRVAIGKELVDDRFFVLSSGVAGEILQKFVNYGAKIAIYGDYSAYTSKPLKDFIYESNNGSDVFFVSTKEEAVEKLAAAR